MFGFPANGGGGGGAGYGAYPGCGYNPGFYGVGTYGLANGTGAAPSTEPTENTALFTLSSNRFNFSDTLEEEEGVNCIDNSKHMFAGFKENPPTLEDALKYMEYGDEKSRELSSLLLSEGKRKLEEIDAPGLIPKDIAVILCYTFEWDYRRFEGLTSPYRMLNDSLSIDRSNASLKKTRGFLFLLLQSLRKLPHYTPANGVLYRGIRVHVQTEMDPNSPKTKPYAAGNEKTWWTFTSTTEDLEATKTFIGESEGTLFTVAGKPWGYDISMFSDYPDEKEILLEPERKLKITSVSREGDIISVSTEMMKTPLVLEDLIKVKTVKIKLKTSKYKAIPKNLRVDSVTDSAVELSWDQPNSEADKVLSYQVSVKRVGSSSRLFNRNAERTFEARETRYTMRNLDVGKEYEFRVRCKFGDGWGTWGEKTQVKVDFTRCVWRMSPDGIEERMKYSVDKKNPRIASKTWDGCCSTIIGNTYLFPNVVSSWSIRLIRSKRSAGGNGKNCTYVGVAPFDIDQGKAEVYQECGWYINFFDSKLHSGPPHNYKGEKYGDWKGDGQSTNKGNTVGVVMDMAKGELSFVVNGMNLGAAYEGIPLDKPLVPCVIHGNGGDSIELDTSEVTENFDSSIPIPSYSIAKSTAAWDSITLKWDAVEGASFYQIEVDGSKSWYTSTTNSYTVTGLLDGSEHSFRVRVVKGNSVGMWNDPSIGATVQAPSFKSCVWKQCPDNLEMRRKYVVNGNDPRIATNINDNFCTVIGNAPIPLDTMVLWNIRILNSSMNNGYNIYVGVAPAGINQNEKDSFKKCGWYFNCFNSTLVSGFPKSNDGKIYGPMRRYDGQYVQTGATVSVMMDTTKGNISFYLNGMNLGVAFEGIPLNKPLVPCVVLYYPGDSVGIII